MANKPASSTEVLDRTSLGAIAGAVSPFPLADEPREAIRTRLFARINPSAPEGTRTVHAAQMQWHHLLPGVDVKMLRRSREGNNQTVLLRLHPGGVIPGHWHTVEEECLVLEGEIRFGDYRVRQGDMHICSPGYAHPDITSENGALLLVRSEISYQPGCPS